MLDYLTLRPEVFGIDISDLSVKIIKLKKKKEFLSLASFGEMAIKPGIIEGGEIKNEDALPEIIKKALSQVKGEKIGTKYAVVSLPEEKAFSQVIQMPLMNEEEAAKAIYFEAENYIPLPIESVYLDAQIVGATSNHPDHADVLIAALPKKTVDSYLYSLRKAGLKPLVFEIESQAIARSLVGGEKSSEPLLLIDFGATRTSFIIFSEHSLRFTTSLPISSRQFTETIAARLKVSLEQAEELKKKYGISGAKGKEIFNILSPNLANLASQIKKYIDYYQTHPSHEHLMSNGKNLEKIVICGGGSSLKGLNDFLSKELQLKIIIGNPWSNILPASPSGAPCPVKEVPGLPYQESLRYATALGLALRGVNLYD